MVEGGWRYISNRLFECVCRLAVSPGGYVQAFLPAALISWRSCSWSCPLCLRCSVKEVLSSSADRSAMETTSFWSLHSSGFNGIRSLPIFVWRFQSYLLGTPSLYTSRSVSMVVNVLLLCSISSNFLTFVLCFIPRCSYNNCSPSIWRACSSLGSIRMSRVGRGRVNVKISAIVLLIKDIEKCAFLTYFAKTF